MSVEPEQEKEIRQQVNKVFEELYDVPVEERIAFAALDMASLQRIEKVAEMDLFHSWFEEKPDRRVKRRAFASNVIAVWGGYLARGFAGFVPDADNSYEQQPRPTPSLQTPTSKEAGLRLARMRMESAKTLLPSLYNLTPRQMKEARLMVEQPERSKGFSA